MTTRIDERQIQDRSLTYASFREELGYWDETKNYARGDIVRYKGKVYKASQERSAKTEGDLSDNPEVSNYWVLVFDPASSLVRTVKALADSHIDTSTTIDKIDNVTINVGDRVFLNGENNDILNGYYVKASDGKLYREKHINIGADIDGTAFIVTHGDTYNHTFWIVNADNVVGSGHINAERVRGTASSSYNFYSGIYVDNYNRVYLGSEIKGGTTISLKDTEANASYNLEISGDFAYVKADDYSKEINLSTLAAAGENVSNGHGAHIILQPSEIQVSVLSSSHMGIMVFGEDQITFYHDKGLEYSWETISHNATNSYWLADKGYVDSVANVIRLDLLATGNVDLHNPPSSIDGVTITNGMIIGLFNQTIHVDEGIYRATVSNGNVTLHRYTWFPTGIRLKGRLLYVRLGTSHGSKLFKITNTNNAAIGSDNINYAEFTTSSSGSGLQGSGTATQIAYFSNANTLTSSNNLYWDATNFRLGIKTTHPSYTLQVEGITKTTKLGVNKDPSNDLDVSGITQIDGSLGININPNYDLHVEGITKTTKLGVNKNPSNDLDVSGITQIDGSLGINISPNYDLHVVGDSYLKGSVFTGNTLHNSGVVNGFEIGNSTASSVIDVDSSGKLVAKWNSTAGSNETYLVDSEDAVKLSLLESNSIMDLFYATSGNAGDTISWNNILHISNTEFQYMGKDIITEDNINSYTDSRYVNVTGDTMTGKLTMNNANIEIDDASFVFKNVSANSTVTLSSTSTQLKITNSTVGNYLSLGPSSNAGCYFYTDSPLYFFNKDITLGLGGLNSDSSAHLIFRPGGNEVARVTTDTQRVGIGTTHPTEKLDVNGWIRSDKGFTVDRRSFTLKASSNNYYRIGVGSGKCNGIYKVQYTVSGHHGELMFQIGNDFGQNHYTFNLFYYHYYSTQAITYVQFAKKGTYDDMYVDLYIVNPSSSDAMTVYVIQLDKGENGFNMPATITQSPALPSGYTSSYYHLIDMASMTRYSNINTSGETYTDSYFKPGVGYKSSDGSVGINASVSLLGSDGTTKYTLTIKDGLVTEVTSTI